MMGTLAATRCALSWDGELNELRKAQARLLLTVPLALLLVALLAYAAVKNWKDTLLVLSNIPVAGAGGIVALLLTGIHLSVSAAMGFVSVFGIAVQDAILVVSYFQRLTSEGRCVSDAAREAVEKRLRPVLMTALVAMLGLTPAALSHGIGSQTQRPLAIVVIGGATMLLLASRILQPSLLVLVHRVRLPAPANRRLWLAARSWFRHQRT
jgi:cobalt-zinc-cadmium resistance protein CzcA